MTDRIPVTDRESWLALRKRDVTASVVAALFGAHQYTSARQLYIDKTTDAVDEIDSAVLRRGRLLESAVAVAVEEDHPQWKLTKATDYFRDPDIRLGATPDFFVDGDTRGLGIIQAKTVAPSAFKKSWTEDGPPLWIAMQTICEMMLTGAAWGAVAALVVDPWRMECKVYPVPRHAGMERRIREATAEFWANTDAGFEPAFDYAKDAELIASLYPDATPLKSIDLSGDNYLPVLLAERTDIKARGKVDAERLKTIDAEIADKMGDAEIATIDGFTITNKTTNRKAYEVKATSYRALRVTDHRPKDATSDSDEF
jgi:predicted phage-related endonuclease